MTTLTVLERFGLSLVMGWLLFWLIALLAFGPKTVARDFAHTYQQMRGLLLRLFGVKRS